MKPRSIIIIVIFLYSLGYNSTTKAQDVQTTLQKIDLMRQKAQKQLKILKPQQANEYFEEFKQEIGDLVHKINNEENNYLRHYYEYRHDKDWNPITPPDSIVKKETSFKHVGLTIIEEGEGNVALGLSNRFYKDLFANKLTPDYQTYLALKEAEGNDPIVQDAYLVISQKELADLILKHESFIDKYSDSKQYEKVNNCYRELQNIYLFGIDNSPVMDVSNARLYENAKKEFQRFVNTYPESPTSQLATIILAEKETDYSKLRHEITQLQTGEEATEDISYQEADKELNKVYKQILKKYEKAPMFLKKLKMSQRLWIQFRDAELEMRFPMENKRVVYGTVYFSCKEQYLIDMTIARTKTLKEWLDDVDEYDSCNGSKGILEEIDY